jgi:Sulfotransferase domain
MGVPSLRQLRHDLSRTPLRAPLVWFRHRGVLAADAWLASYPRSGNTWLRFLLFELVTGRTAEFGEIDARDSPTGQLGDQRHMPPVLAGGGRLIKTHELYRPQYRRAVYLVRDPRDVVTSEQRFLRWRGYGRGRDPDFVEAFLRGAVSGFGSWRRHVVSWLDSAPAAGAEVLLVRYEDLRTEPGSWLGKIVAFLGLEIAEGALVAAVEHNSIASMRQREDRARDTVYGETDPRFRFVNRGRVGGWRETLDPRAAARIEERWAATMEKLGYAPGGGVGG